MGESTRAMQRDDTQNPAMLWVGDGEALWDSEGRRKRQVVRRLPRQRREQHARRRRPLSQVRATGGRRRHARAAHQPLPRAPSAGRPVQAGKRRASRPRELRRDAVARHAGRAAAGRRTHASGRRGGPQRSTSSASASSTCRARSATTATGASSLAGAPIPQGHANAYPIYRLEWQSVGSLQRRLRNCMSGVRAEVPPFGAQELVRLEAYLAVARSRHAAGDARRAALSLASKESACRHVRGSIQRRAQRSQAPLPVLASDRAATHRCTLFRCLRSLLLALLLPMQPARADDGARLAATCTGCHGTNGAPSAARCRRWPGSRRMRCWRASRPSSRGAQRHRDDADRQGLQR